jgi:hypothetical protein
MKVRFDVSVLSGTAFPHRRDLDKFAELIRIIDGSGVELIGSLEPGSRMRLTTRARVRSRQRLPSGPSNRSRPILRAVPRTAST